MSNNDLWRLSASELAAKTRAGDITAEEAVGSSLARMDAVNPSLNAVVDSMAEAAREKARALDKARADGATPGPLHGLPVTIKVNIDQAGHATTNGVVALKDAIAPADAPLVENLTRAGAVVIGRTNTPEFSFRADTDNPLHGRTHNPWGTHLSPGGSSGGAGAAVMAGIGALAHGNDIGGSLRFPAAANGAVTVKPGLGRVAAWNPSQKVERGMLAQAMSVQGLITRAGEDLHLGMPEMIRPDPRDPFHVPLPWRGDPLEEPIKVAFTKDSFGRDLHPEVSAALDTARDALIDAGYLVEEVATPDIEACGNAAYRALMGEVHALLRDDIDTYGSETIQSIFASYFHYYPPYEGTEQLKMMAERTRFARDWSLFLDEYPLVLSPFLLTPFFAPNRDAEGEAGAVEALGAAHWSFAMNFMGLPAGNVPARLVELDNGPNPIGVQIVGRRWREDLVVDALIAIEDRVGRLCGQLWDQMEKA